MKRTALLVGLILFPATFTCEAVQAAEHEKEKAYGKVAAYVAQAAPSKKVLIPEGEFVTVFNQQAAVWISQKLTPAVIKEISDKLAAELAIPLSPRGFAAAANRDTSGAADATNYDAVWVRDSAWVFYSLLETPSTHGEARRLILALWDYYSGKKQVERFDDIIARPANAADKMKVPHIRFDGKNKDLDDVQTDGRPEVWNHRQNDAHGIFLVALADAVEKGLVRAEDLTDARLRGLSRFPAYFDAIRFEAFEDAGAWEEIDRKNTSSIGMVSGAMGRWRSIIKSVWKDTPAKSFRDALAERLVGLDEKIRASWTEKNLNALAERGMATVRRQLALGGESPDYSPDDIRFRRADAYLLSLIVPSPLEGLSEAEMRQVLQIVETLKRPAGILRYANDSYQSGNFWISVPGETAAGEGGSGTGDTSSRDAFIGRLSKLVPDTEAQWFFDSILVLARLHLASMARDPVQKKQDVFLAGIHLKRALGQLTGTLGGSGPVDAQGNRVKPMLLPESINSVVVGGKVYLLPSPIVPLNWSKAALKMALERYGKVLNQGN
jgi:hypothetical protein